MKAYKCYDINGFRELVFFNPMIGNSGIEPDAIEIYLQPYVKEAERADGVRCIEYNNMLYFDINLIYNNGKICVKKYKSGDEIGHPTGRIVTVGIIK